jgi:L-rhamnose mutarotase
MKRYVMVLDLVDDPQLIKEYEDYHREVWPEIKRSILDAGILQMEIYRFENRLFMNMEVGEDFSFEKKSAMDAANEKVQDWEQQMRKYQAASPGAKPGEKWVMMTKIFELV